MKQATESSDKEKTYELPDGNIIPVGLKFGMATGMHCAGGSCEAHNTTGDNEISMLQTERSKSNGGFWCKAAWCSTGSVCCDNGAYGLCGSPGTTCCESPGGIINLCAPGSQCNEGMGIAMSMRPSDRARASSAWRRGARREKSVLPAQCFTLMTLLGLGSEKSFSWL